MQAGAVPLVSTHLAEHPSYSIRGRIEAVTARICKQPRAMIGTRALNRFDSGEPIMLYRASGGTAGPSRRPGDLTLPDTKDRHAARLPCVLPEAKPSP